MDYTHWLVTQGDKPFRRKRRSFTPMLLTPVETSMPALREAVESEARRRSLILVPDGGAEPMGLLVALCSSYATQLASNLFLHRCAPAPYGTPAFHDEEIAIHWKLRGDDDDIPIWQGPADGVITRSHPVTRIDCSSEPTAFLIVD